MPNYGALLDEVDRLNQAATNAYGAWHADQPNQQQYYQDVLTSLLSTISLFNNELGPTADIANIFNTIEGMINRNDVSITDILTLTAAATDLLGKGLIGTGVGAEVGAVLVGVSKLCYGGLVLYDLLHKKSQPDPKVSDDYNAAQNNPIRYDPLTLDLNGDGLNTVALRTPPLLFDLNATGIKTSVGWVAPDDGLLVMDRNGNGTIDSGAELFGNATPSYEKRGQCRINFRT
jgi:hypothetical protein